MITNDHVGTAQIHQAEHVVYTTSFDSTELKELPVCCSWQEEQGLPETGARAN
jgi:hypothetical protein